MGQVPLLVGSGRMAHHLAHWLELESIAHRRWARNSGTPLSEGAEDASAILLAVSDGAIGVLTDEIGAMMPGTPIYHFSGAISVPRATAVHPLMTFGPSLYELPTYRLIHFVCDPGHSIQELFPKLPNPSHCVNPQLRPYYHALCVMAGNLPQILWRKAWQDLPSELDLPSEALEPYLRQAVENFIADPTRALTGPLARGDRETIASHLKALDRDPFAPIYSSFVDLMRKPAERRST